MEQTILQKYLKKCPAALNDEKKLLGLVADALNNDARKIHALQFAYKAGLVDILRREGGLSDEKKERVRTRLMQEYAMVPKTAEKAICYWEASIDEEILKAAEAERRKLEADAVKEVLSQTAIPYSRESKIELFMIRHNPGRNGISIQWNRRSDMTYYEIWRAEENEPAEKIKEGRFPMPRYTDMDVRPGVKYAYAVRGWQEDDEQKIDFVSNDAELIAPGEQNAFQISEVKAADSSIQLKWTICYGAEKYVLLSKENCNSQWKTAAEMPLLKSQYLDENVQGSRYYKVKCVLLDGSVQETDAVRASII